MLTRQRVEELDLSILQSRKFLPSDVSKGKQRKEIREKPQAITMTLAWTLKIPMFVFLSCSSAKLHTEKKRPAGGWGMPHSGQCKCMLLVSWICVVTQENAVQPAHAVYHVLITYPEPKSHWAETLKSCKAMFTGRQ
jgi:hypothetical protein